MPPSIAEAYKVLVGELTYANIAWEIHRGFAGASAKPRNNTGPDESILPFLRHAVESEVALALCRLLDKDEQAAGFARLLQPLPGQVAAQVQQELDSVQKERDSVKWWRDKFLAHIDQLSMRQVMREGFNDPKHLFFLNGAPRILKAVRAALTQIAHHYGLPAPSVDPPAQLADEVEQFLRCRR